MLLEFLYGLKSFGIEWRLSPNGALLQYHGRMVAMILLDGSELRVSPVSGPDQCFELEVAEEISKAIDLVQHLKSKTWFLGKVLN
jgi:hypothetical protein